MVTFQADKDFNEDACVQLQNLKTQQALIGLANRRNFYYNDKSGQQEGQYVLQLSTAAILESVSVKYTQQEAQRYSTRIV